MTSLIERYGANEVARLALAERCRRSLAQFVRHAWHILEPGTPLRWNWHIDAVCRVLEAVSRGDLRRVIINIPPGTMKSLLVSVFWPAWVWTWRPEWRPLFGSYAIELSMRDSVRCRAVVSSTWYRTTFAPTWQLSGDQNVKSYFENTQRGFRMALSVGSAGTGFRGDAVVVDDPLNAKEAHSEPAREEALTWWTQTMPTRVNDPATGVFVIVMQRLHEEDLTGHMLKSGGYAHLCLPMEYEPDLACACGQKPCITGSLGKLDPRTAPGELLFPEMFTREVLAELKRTMGSAVYAGQEGQRPSPAEGGMFKRSWWKRYKVAPAKFDEVVQSWDFAFKETSTSDYVVGQVWGRVGAECWLLDQVRDRMDFTASLAAIEDLSAKWPQAKAKLIEDKANGSAVITSLKKKISGLIEIQPDGGKQARASAVTPFVEAGNVYIPEAGAAAWASDYVEELAAFPNGANDDQVDCTSQALARLMLFPAGPTAAERLQNQVKALQRAAAQLRR
jgi:predicted phage terminase large subunit-like protein